MNGKLLRRLTELNASPDLLSIIRKALNLRKEKQAERKGWKLVQRAQDYNFERKCVDPKEGTKWVGELKRGTAPQRHEIQIDNELRENRPCIQDYLNGTM